MFGLIFTGLLFLIVVAAVLVFLFDTRPHALRSLQRQIVALVIAMVAAGAIVLAAETQPKGCNDFEPYSFLWYFFGCFLDSQSH